MSDTVRWGILGTGGIARAFALGLKHAPGAVLAAVGSRTLDSAQTFARELDIEQAYGSYQALADAPDVDIIYIGTPHPMHAENALLALGGGKAVLCEKPFTMNRVEAGEVVALARAKGLFLMEAMWTRFMPALAEVKRIMASGEIGTITQMHADFGYSATLDPEHRVNKLELGGGALLDLGIYPLSIACALLGNVDSVRAQAVFTDTGVDATTAFTMKHSGGTLSVCSCSMRARSASELIVSGTRGSIRMRRMFHLAERITVELMDGSSRTIPTPWLGNGYTHEAIEAGRCLREGLLEHPWMTLDDSLTLMALLDDIRSQIGLRYPSDA
ncbi:Gfo/Idh/MocA family oxidoreductase [Massilia sp. G4R7]|uniref:Gfo/Idh/MocA family oxidoreductase n=1 Tax=Massilia phyllostachyos TaxID=2898585 RepID=A0ABS8Q8G0_9BURK|nr:Gfo/Idh/MocA family oxidoreductase [Massilia phyllostachyos]MCD2517990.1 Gfo/Idh/MocA family oxidoreductase [Massilia phyllostachyos]